MKYYPVGKELNNNSDQTWSPQGIYLSLLYPINRKPLTLPLLVLVSLCQEPQRQVLLRRGLPKGLFCGPVFHGHCPIVKFHGKNIQESQHDHVIHV